MRFVFQVERWEENWGGRATLLQQLLKKNWATVAAAAVGGASAAHALLQLLHPAAAVGGDPQVQIEESGSPKNGKFPSCKQINGKERLMMRWEQKQWRKWERVRGKPNSGKVWSRPRKTDWLKGLLTTQLLSGLYVSLYLLLYLYLYLYLRLDFWRGPSAERKKPFFGILNERVDVL